MNAPSGIDSDYSSGEDEVSSPPYSPVSPSKSHFSLKALFLPTGKLDKDKAANHQDKPEKISGNQFESSGIARAPSPIQLRAPKKKTVRIYVNGEKHPDSTVDDAQVSPSLDLAASPTTPLSVGDAGSPWARAMSPFTSPGPRGQGPPANEVFQLLRQLIVETTRAREDGSTGARLDPLDEPSDVEAPAPPVKDMGGKMKTKPSKLKKLAKMTKLTSPPKQDSSSDASSSFSATDGFRSPVRPDELNGFSQQDQRGNPAHIDSNQPSGSASSFPSMIHYQPPDDRANRLPDGRRAHNLADEYYHPERYMTSRSGELSDGAGKDRPDSQLPYLAQFPVPPGRNNARGGDQQARLKSSNPDVAADRFMPSALRSVPVLSHRRWGSDPRGAQAETTQNSISQAYSGQPWQNLSQNENPAPQTQHWNCPPYGAPGAQHFQPPWTAPSYLQGALGYHVPHAQPYWPEEPPHLAPLSLAQPLQPWHPCCPPQIHYIWGPPPWYQSHMPPAEQPHQSDASQSRPDDAKTKVLPGASNAAEPACESTESQSAPMKDSPVVAQVQDSRDKSRDPAPPLAAMKTPESPRTSDKGEDKDRTQPQNASAAPHSGPRMDESSERRTPAPLSLDEATGIKKRLDKAQSQREQLKRRIHEGRIDRAEGKKELEVLTKLRDGLESRLKAATSKETGSVSVKDPGAASSRDKKTLNLPSGSLRDMRAAGATVPTSPPRAPQNSKDKMKEQITDIEKRMVRVKSKMLNGGLEKEEGEKMLAKLDTSRRKMRETLAAMDDPDSELVKNEATSTVTGDAVKEVEMKMKRLKIKVKDGSVAKDEAEKAMKRLLKAKAELEKGAEANRETTGEASREDRSDLTRELDLDILEQVLAEIPSKSGEASNSENKNTERRTKPDERVQSSKGFQGHGIQHKGSRHEDETGSSEQLQNPTPDSRRVKLQIPGAWHDDRVRQSVHAATIDASQGQEEVTWTKCLVSIAHCIDLGTDLSRYLISRQRHSKDNGDQSTSLVVEILPRLLTSLMFQRDIVSCMRGILGDEHSKMMGAFLEHIIIVKRFLEDQYAKEKERKSRKDKANDDVVNVEDAYHGLVRAFESGSLHAIIDHVLGLSDFSTPHLLSTLKDALQEWRDDGFSFRKIIRVIMTVREELDKASKNEAKRLRSDKASVEPSGTLDLLDKLLHFAESDSEGRRVLKSQGEGLRIRRNESNRKEARSVQSQHNYGIADKVAQMLHLDGIRDSRRRESEPEKAGSVPRDSEAPSRLHRLRRPEASGSPARPSSRPPPTHHHVSSTADIPLPPITSEFLASDSASPRAHRRRPSGPAPKHDHHSTIVRPPGPAPEARGSHHHATIDIEEYPEAPKNLKRGDSMASKASKYSQDSEGTVESDEEAKELLGNADSGPKPLQSSGLGEEQNDSLPSGRQVRMAREVLRGGPE
ncbi:hypothetical protein BD324DRAFT_650963 [Kockovaella imperatae]|uniref:Uncharacterized protein n=1 Tax=Kockovaella imperatae TaxID=4999 RepID=A0A1Y1UIP1_9TREE|nr:hypothetical protein BD324DRAFT_650963 [Kockovaella imperatae]ORX37366.1 hypothetical protein BD324DRAFT_650963 [Kockovaella imperatae]